MGINWFAIKHPIITKWMINNKLKLKNPNTGYGLFADTDSFKLEDSLYSFLAQDDLEELKRFNQTFGTNFDYQVLNIPSLTHRLTLFEMSQKVKNNKGNDSKIYLGGVSVPKRDLIYVEFLKPGNDGGKTNDIIPIDFR